MKDLKYLLAFIPMLAVYLGIYLGGYWTFSGVIIAFVFIPLIEQVSTGSTQNFLSEEESNLLSIRFFDILLYLNVPLLYGLIIYYFWTISLGQSATYELVGMTLSVGIICSTCGINVAHELGHRDNKFEQFLSKVLLLPEFYMHFFIEHNLGHHKNVATSEDPASSRYGENIYAFFWRSVSQGYLSAWAIEGKLLKKKQQAFWGWHNRVLQFQIIQLIYLAIIGLVFGWQILPYAITIGIIGFLLLEAVNYIEHYGLERKQLPSGKYEPVQPHHSWNSNHPLGRIILYELTRHSDHHFKSNRKYQILRHFDESPNLPNGYPAAILTALIPPLWFSSMNPRVKNFAMTMDHLD